MTEKSKRSNLPTAPQGFARRCWEQIRLAWLLFQDNRVSLRVKLIPIVGLTYLLSPFGLIPALIPIIGQIDVLAVILITVALFNGAAPDDVVTEYLAQLRTGSKPTWKVAQEEGGTVIDNRISFVDEAEPTPEKQAQDKSETYKSEQAGTSKTRR